MASRHLSPFERDTRLANPLFDLHREVNRVFEDMFGLAPFGAGLQGSAFAAMPRLDVRETGGELCVSAELPGVQRADLDVRLDADVLSISGEKKSESRSGAQQENAHMIERSYGRFQRSLQLPFAPDPEQVQAEFENGVLTVRLQKRGQQKRGQQERGQQERSQQERSQQERSQQERSRRIEVREPGAQAQAGAAQRGGSDVQDGGGTGVTGNPGSTGSTGGEPARTH